MSINRTVVRTWLATVTLHNGQTLEMEVRGRTISECRETLKQDAHVKKIVHIKKGSL